MQLSVIIKIPAPLRMVSTFPTAISLVIVHPADGLLNMDSLAVFQFDSQEIRFVDGKPVANDVATVLGFKNPADAVFKTSEG